MKKYSVVVNDHSTSITLEEDFWKLLHTHAQKKKLSLNQLISKIDKTRAQKTNLSSAVRLYILQSLIK